MTKPIRTIAALSTAAVSTAALLALGGPANASHGGGNDDRVIKTGSCSDGARWKLKVKSDNSALEVEGEVDSNRSGQTWSWKIEDNGAVAAKGSSTTGGRSGSFSVERRIPNGSGTDLVTFRATHAGEVCTGTISF